MLLVKDNITRIAYSTDASAYQEMPEAVAFPRTEQDIRDLITYARENNKSLIPRGAGTSIAGQVVGSGIVLDMKHFNRILEINVEEQWVRVEPAVVRDELNLELKKYSLFFSPETSTSNRCTIGGMMGNNSCGTHSLRYGSVRDKLIDAKVIWADDDAERRGRDYLANLLFNTEVQREIEFQFPDKRLRRRNNGYALDMVLQPDGSVNLLPLLCGSEGTLGIVTELKLRLDPLPPAYNALACIHCDTFDEAFSINLEMIKLDATAVELIDDKILKLSENSPSQRENRFWLIGNPKAVVCAEFAAETEEKLEILLSRISILSRSSRTSILYGKDIQKVWALRKAALGLLGNVWGDDKPAPVIEDTAVAPEFLSDYISDFQAMLKELNLDCVFYAHMGSGELHLRPVLNMKSDEGKRLFREVAERTALLVKKYHGSLSGEHGDGRLRGEFIPLMYGEKVYEWMRGVKHAFDPQGIFNPGKIVDTPRMDEYLRYQPDGLFDNEQTMFAYQGAHNGIHMKRAAEQCNGAADCRKSFKIGGIMCPVYKATAEEIDTTRARANIIRAVLEGRCSQSEANMLLDRCLSCKGCKRDCPSGVDITWLKAELAQKRGHFSFRKYLIALTPYIPLSLYHFFEKSRIAFYIMGFHPSRTSRSSRTSRTSINN